MNQPAPRPPATVIGGGLVGLVTAFELQDQGFQVRLIDPAPASQATRFAGGMLAPVAEVQYRQEALYPLMTASGELFPDLISRLAAVTELPTGYRAEGTLVVARDRADATHLRELATHQQNHGMQVEQVSTRQARRMEPALSPGLASAVSIPGDHQVAPRELARALLAALSQGGAELVTDRVLSLSPADDSPEAPINRIHCEDQKIDLEDEVVVLANGLGAAEIGGWHDCASDSSPLQLRSVYGDVLIVRNPPDQPELLTRVVRGFVEDRPIYLIPRSRGEIMIGATSREDHSALTPVGAIHGLLRDAISLVPALEEAGLVEWGTGARPGTPDDLPYLGRVRPNLIISTGYFRHGILLSALAAQVSAIWASGREPEPEVRAMLRACEPMRFASPMTKPRAQLSSG